MKMNKRIPGGPLMLLASGALLTAFCLLQPPTVKAQWTTPDANQNINNTNSGNVGIGTTTPNALLEVKKSHSAVTNIIVDNPFTTAGNSAYSAFTLKQAGVNRLHIASVNDNHSFITPGTAQFWNFANAPTVFANNNTETMRISAAGNLGIGTTNPLSQLHFGTLLNAGVRTYTSSATNHGFLFSSYMDTIGPHRRYGDIVAMSNQDGNSGGSTIRFLTNPHNSFTALERMRIDYLGNVGIGATAPTNLLHINSGATPSSQFRISANSAGSLSGLAYSPDNAALGFDVDWNGVGWIARHSTLAALYKAGGKLQVLGWTGATVGSPIPDWTVYTSLDLTSGKFGIGVANPTYKLDVQGGQINSSGGLCIAGDCKTAWSQVGGTSQWSGTGPIHYTGGNVGIGTTSPTQKLDVAGAIASSGTTVIDASRNITNVGNGTFSGTLTNTALQSYVANSSNAVITPSGSPAIGINAQRFDQYVSRSAIGGLFAQYIYPTNTGSFYSYGVWSRAQSVTAGTSTVSETIGVLSDSFSTRSVYNAAVKANALMVGDHHEDGAVFGIDAIAGPAAGVTLTQRNSIYGVRSIAKGLTYGSGDTVYGLYASGSGGSLNYGIYSAAGTNHFNGNVGIGNSSPTEKLHVTGNGKFTGNLTVDGTVEGGNIKAKYQDLAEWVPSAEQLPAGTVVVLDATKSNQVISSSQSYDTRVAGVISAQPGITLGESGEGKVLVATTGRVRVKVDASRSSIQIGDLLVTSDIPGVAMKSEAVEFAGRKMHMPGTIIGKALEPLAKSSGEILVLLSLQ